MSFFFFILHSLEGVFGGGLVLPSSSFKVGSSLSTSKDGQFVTSLGDLSQCSARLVVKKTFLVLKEHIYFSIYPLNFTICISDFSIMKLLVIALCHQLLLTPGQARWE